MNTNIFGVIHGDVAFVLVIILFDSKLVCKFCEYLSEEWSVAIQKKEQILCTSS